MSRRRCTTRVHGRSRHRCARRRVSSDEERRGGGSWTWAASTGPARVPPVPVGADRAVVLGEDGQQLAETFPSDHFKDVSGYGGEKDYQYEARELVGLGVELASNRTRSTSRGESSQTTWFRRPIAPPCHC